MRWRRWPPMWAGRLRRDDTAGGAGEAPAPGRPEGSGMKLAWDRPGVVVMTAKVEELALLVAAGRVAAAAFESQPGEQAAALNRLLHNLDRSIEGLRRQETSRA